MFNALYRCHRTIERHINNPLADATRLCLATARNLPGQGDALTSYN
jgi:hypothetical protein